MNSFPFSFYYSFRVLNGYHFQYKSNVSRCAGCIVKPSPTGVQIHWDEIVEHSSSYSSVYVLRKQHRCRLDRRRDVLSTLYQFVSRKASGTDAYRGRTLNGRARVGRRNSCLSRSPSPIYWFPHRCRGPGKRQNVVRVISSRRSLTINAWVDNILKRLSYTFKNYFQKKKGQKGIADIPIRHCGYSSPKNIGKLARN